MTLLDAYALVALAAEEPAAEEVEERLREGTCRVVVVNYAEAVDICHRVHGFSHDRIRGVFEPLVLAGIVDLVQSTGSHAWKAAEMRGRYYHRKDAPLSMADCILLAHAVMDGDEIMTSDPPMAQVARSEGLVVHALPGSTGSRP